MSLQKLLKLYYNVKKLLNADIFGNFIYQNFKDAKDNHVLLKF